jgi:HlyD family secretion protein
MAENTKRNWIIGIVVALAAIVALMTLTGHHPAPLVPLAAVTREDITSAISSNGKVEPITPYVARAEYPTFVSDLKATEGQVVRKGQLILTLDSADVRAQLSQTRADLLAAESDLRNSKTGGPPDEVATIEGSLSAARTQVATLEHDKQVLAELLTKQAATQSEVAANQASLDTARANLQTLEAKRAALVQRAAVSTESASLRVNQSRDSLAALGEKVKSATVTAPFDGTLYSLPVHRGDFVKLGDVLAEMADLSKVRVRAFVDEPDIGSLAPDQPIQVSWDAKPGQTWLGKVEQVPRQVIARGTRSVGEVLCSVDNSKIELLPNINVEVRIMVHQLKSVLVVPRAAVRFESGKHYVFVFNGTDVSRRNVEVGIASAASYQVISGLTAGEKVAEPPTGIDLRDGMKIRPTEAK